MAMDVIGIMGVDMEDETKELPNTYSVNIVKEENDIITLVDVDFLEYRKKIENKAVKKN